MIVTGTSMLSQSWLVEEIWLQPLFFFYGRKYFETYLVIYFKDHTKEVWNIERKNNKQCNGLLHFNIVIHKEDHLFFQEFPFQVMIGCNSSVTTLLNLNCNAGLKWKRCALNTISMEGNSINVGKIFAGLSVLKARFIYFSMLFCTSASF